MTYIKIILKKKKKKGEQHKSLPVSEKQNLVEHRWNYVKMYEKTNSKDLISTQMKKMYNAYSMASIKMIGLLYTWVWKQKRNRKVVE